MKKIFFSILFMAALSCAIQATAQDSTQHWSKEKAWNWYHQQP